MANVSQKISLDLLANIKANPIGFEQAIARFKDFIKVLADSNVPADRLQGAFNVIKNSLKGMQAGKLDLSNWEASISSLRQQILNLSTALKEIRGMASRAGVDRSKISTATAPLSTMAMSAHGKLTQQTRAKNTIEDKQYEQYLNQQAEASKIYYSTLRANEAKQKSTSATKSQEEYNKYIQQQARESDSYYAALRAEAIRQRKISIKDKGQGDSGYARYISQQARESDDYYAALRSEGIRQRRSAIKRSQRQGDLEYKQYIQQQALASSTYYSQLSAEGAIQNAPSGLDKFVSGQMLAVGRLAKYYASFAAITTTINAVRTAISETILMQDKMLEVKKFLPVNSATKELENNVYSLAKAYGVSAETVLNSYSEFAQQGLKANQILDATKAALLGVNVASIDFAESTKFLTTATNVWNYNLSQSTMLFDKLSKVQAMSAVTAKAMITAIQKTGSIAHDVGVSMDELLGYIAAITEKTQQSGEVTGNALKTMFERLLRSDSIRKLEAMEPLKGITFRNIQTGELERAGVILSKIAGKWDTLTDIQRKSIGEVIAGGRQINTFTALMSNFESAIRLSGESLNSFGFAQQQNQTEMQKFSKNAQILKNVFLEVSSSALAPFIFMTNKSMQEMSLFGSASMDIVKVVIPGMIWGLSALALTSLPALINTLSLSTSAIGTLAKAFTELKGGLVMAHLTEGMALLAPEIIAAAVAIGVIGAAWKMFNSQQQEAIEKTEATSKAINDLADAFTKLGKNIDISDINKELEKLTVENIEALPERIQKMLVFGEGGRVSLAKGVDPKILRRAVLAQKVYTPPEVDGGAKPSDVLKEMGITKDTEITIDKIKQAYAILESRISNITETTRSGRIIAKEGYDEEYKRLTNISDKFKELSGLKRNWLSGAFEDVTQGSFIKAAQTIASIIKSQEQLSIKPTSEAQEKLELQKSIIEKIGIEMEKGLFTAQQKSKEFDIENELLENLKAQQFELGVKEIELREQVNKGIDGSKEKYDEVIKKNEIVKALIGDQKDILQRMIALLNQDYFINIKFNIDQIIDEKKGALSGINLGKTAGVTPAGTLQKVAEEAKARTEVSTKEYTKYANEVNKLNQQISDGQTSIANDEKKGIISKSKFRQLEDLKAAQITAKSQEDIYSKTADQKVVRETEVNRKIQEARLALERKEAKDTTRADKAGQKSTEDKAHLEALRKVHEIEAQIALTKQFQSYWEGKLEDSYLLRYDRETEALQTQIDNNKNILESVKDLNEEDRNRYNEKIKELNTELEARKRNREEAIKINEEEKRAKAFKRGLERAGEQFAFGQELKSIAFSGRYGISPEEQAAFNIQQQYESILFEKQKAQAIYQEKYRITLDAIVTKQKMQKDFSMEIAQQQANQLALQSEEVENADNAVLKQQQKLEILYKQAEVQREQRAYAGVDEVKGVLSNLFQSFNPITIYEQQKAKAKQMADAYTEMAKAQSDANKAAQDVASAEATGNLDKINSAREKYTQTLNQIDQIKTKMQDINSETNKWMEALKSIGNILMKKIIDQLSDVFLEKSGITEILKSAFGSINAIGKGPQATTSGLTAFAQIGGVTGLGGMAGAGLIPAFGAAGAQQQVLQQIIMSGQGAQMGMGSPLSFLGGSSTSGMGKWLNKPLDKWGGTGMGYLSSAMMGYGIGQATKSKAGGALGGALMGYMSAGPIGAIIGGLSGLFGAGKDEEAPPPVKEREFYSTQKNTDALDRNTAALMKLSEGVFNAPSTFEMPRLDAKSNITQSINIYVGAGANSKAISSAVADGVYKANMSTFGTKTSNIVG